MLFKERQIMLAPASVSYGKGVLPAEYQPEVIDRLNAIEKIAHQLIYGVQGEDKLSIFDKMPVDKGTTIEQMVIKLAESTAFDPTATDVFKPNFENKPVVQYFKDWSQAQFNASVSYNDIRKVLTGETNEADIAELIVSSLTQGDIHEKYTNAKGLLKYGADNSIMTKVDETIDVTSTNGYKSLLKAMKNTIKGFGYVSDRFNTTTGLKTKTPSDRIRIIAPYDIISDLDVDELSGVFNLSKAEIADRIIETDALDDKRIYIVDKFAVMIYTRLYMLTMERNQKALFDNYWLTVDRLYAISPLFNSAYIEYTRGE